MPTVHTVRARIAQGCGLEIHTIEDAYQCTSLQVAMLVAGLSAKADYVSTWVFDVSAASGQRDWVRTAMRRLYHQTPVLRTRFFEIKGRFLQVVTNLPLPWIEHDNLADYLHSDARHEIGLGDNAARFAWIVQGDRCYLVWTLHHALYDEWSINLIFDDFRTLVLRRHLPKRPAFSKFIKFLCSIDHQASEAFWKSRLNALTSTQSICPQMSGSYRTSRSDHSKISHLNILSQSTFQMSTLTMAMWSLTLSVLTASNVVAFGLIVNGRTTDIPGIADMCGPTMTTVPYVVKLPFEETLQTFLISLEQLQSNILPFEQTALDMYRSSGDTPPLDTLLSIRSPENSTIASDIPQWLLPRPLGKRRISHPCAIYLDIVFEADECSLNASYDDRWINHDLLRETLQQVSAGIKHLLENLHLSLGDFVASLHLPASLRRLDATHHQSAESPPLPSPSGSQTSQVDKEILDQICRVAKNVSPLHSVGDKVDPQTTLGGLGLDSLGSVVLARRLSEAFHVAIPSKYLTGRQRSISQIAQSLQTIIQGTGDSDNHTHGSQISLHEKAEQHSLAFLGIGPCPVASTTPASILLTGASGYLGIEILRQCLLSTEEAILLPVRCSSPEQGLARIRRAAQIRKWQDTDLALLNHRVCIWPCDLSAENLELDAEKLQTLQSVRAIIHNGARVNFLLDYHDLEAINVTSTAFLLSTHLRSVSRPCFVYVTGGRGPAFDGEDDLLTVASRLKQANGYAQGKFTSEVLCHRAQRMCTDNKREAQISIVHPGIVIGDPETGVANTDDFIWRYVATSVQMRVYVPAVPTKREWIGITTVDAAAHATVAAATTCHESVSKGTVERHLLHTGIHVASFWKIVIDTLGHHGTLLRAVSETEWLRIFKEDVAKTGKEHPLFSLSELLLEGTMKGIGGQRPRLRREAESSIDGNHPVEKAIAANIGYLMGIGYFDKGQFRLDGQAVGRTKH